MNNVKAIHTIQDALSELLKAERFHVMSAEVLTEYDPARLRRYAQVVLKSAPAEQKRRIAALLRQAGLI